MYLGTGVAEHVDLKGTLAAPRLLLSKYLTFP